MTSDDMFRVNHVEMFKTEYSCKQYTYTCQYNLCRNAEMQLSKDSIHLMWKKYWFLCSYISACRLCFFLLLFYV